MSYVTRSSQRISNGSGSGAGSNGVDWKTFLRKFPNTRALPLWFFQHVPLSRGLRQIMGSNLKIQIKLREEETPEIPDVQGKTVYWVATAIEYFGLMAKVVYEHVEGPTEDYTRFINLISEAKSLEFTNIRMDSSITCYPKSFSWIWNNAYKNQSWPRLVNLSLLRWGRMSLPCSLTIRGELIGRYRSSYEVGELVEALDKSCISQMRVAEVIKLVGGRVHVRYWNSTAKPGEADFVGHELSQTIFKAGWCRTVGHDLSAPNGYNSPILTDVKLIHFIDYTILPFNNIREGAWLEIVDPLKPSVIAAAQISKVLNHGYVMVTINRLHSSTTKCYHITSPSILFCGFCERFQLPLVLPISYRPTPGSQFSWENFLTDTNGVKVVMRQDHFEDEYNPDIQVGMKLEAVDLMEPRDICVATVSSVKGRLLRIAFDGWKDKYDQWMVIKSTEIFPMGWCEANEYPLRPPKGDNGIDFPNLL